MDLSFAPFDRHHELTHLPGDLAVLVVGVAARQAASPTAAVQAGAVQAEAIRRGAGMPGWSACRPEPLLLQPLDGAFNGSMAAIIVRWSEP